MVAFDALGTKLWVHCAEPQLSQVKVSESLDIKGIIVEPSYDGPRLEEDSIITKQFVSHMIHHFKQCHTIHLR